MGDGEAGESCLLGLRLPCLPSWGDWTPTPSEVPLHWLPPSFPPAVSVSPSPPMTHSRRMRKNGPAAADHAAAPPEAAKDAAAPPEAADYGAAAPPEVAEEPPLLLALPAPPKRLAGVSQAPYPAGSAQAPCSACSAPSSLLWNSITILNNCFLLYFQMLFILVMQIWIFSIITQVFIVTWSFRNSSNMLIWCSRIMSSFLLLMHKTTFINLDIPGLRSACFRGQCRVIFSSQDCGNVIGRKGNTILF